VNFKVLTNNPTSPSKRQVTFGRHSKWLPIWSVTREHIRDNLTYLSLHFFNTPCLRVTAIAELCYTPKVLNKIKSTMRFWVKIGDVAEASSKALTHSLMVPILSPRARDLRRLSPTVVELGPAALFTKWEIYHPICPSGPKSWTQTWEFWTTAPPHMTTNHGIGDTSDGAYVRQSISCSFKWICIEAELESIQSWAKDSHYVWLCQSIPRTIWYMENIPSEINIPWSHS